MIKEFTIDRKVWLRAIPGASLVGAPIEDVKATGSYLLREFDGKRCCLGIYLKACGVPDEAVSGIASPGYLHRERPLFRKMIPSWLIDAGTNGMAANSLHAMSMMEVNDNDTSTDSEKEAFLTKAFAEQGIKVTFV